MLRNAQLNKAGDRTLDGNLPNSLKESMAGAGIEDDANTNSDDTIETGNSLDNDAAMSDSLQEADGATVETLADDGHDDSFPQDQDSRTTWDDDEPPRRRSYASMAASMTNEQASAGGSGGLKGPLLAGAAFLLLLGAGVGYLALAVEPPGPPPSPDIKNVSEIGGMAASMIVDQQPEPEPQISIDTPPEPEPVIAVAPEPEPEPVAVTPPPEPESDMPQVVDRAEGTPPAEPRADLQESTEYGPLPVIAANGMRASMAYARRVPIVDLPRISIVMTELGLNPDKTRQAIEQLPPDVSLAFHPYAPALDDLIAAAREVGHESLLALPMQPINYPFDDPGPNVLLVDSDPADNITALYRSLGAAEGYVGVTGFLGSALLASPQALDPILRELARRGLLFIDNNSTVNSVSADLSNRANLPYNRSDRLIDAIPTVADIDEQLMGLESLAKLNGHAIGYAQAYPVTFERLEEWIPLLRSRGIDLVPVSATIGLDDRNPS